MLLIILLCLLIILLFLMILGTRDKFANNEGPKICILLTMYIGPEELGRRSMYETSVLNWLSKTSFEIFVVESSGQYIRQNHPRLHQYSFQQESKFVDYDPCFQERNSILKAFDYFNGFSKFDIIFKITGKYFLETLELVNIPKDTQLILQNLTQNQGQNVEIVGFSKDTLVEIVSSIGQGQTDKNFENTIINAIKSSKYKIYRLGPLKVNPIVAAGDGRLLEYL